MMKRALVLGGGGSAGNAWLIGVVAGLSDGGVDLTSADVLIGTSAGSTAAAQITAADPAELYEATVGAAVPPGRAPDGGGARIAELMAATRRVYEEAESPAAMRVTMGAAALEKLAVADPDVIARRRAVVAARLPSPDWPHQRVLLTAVDADTGEPVVFDNHSVELVDAVTASCAGPGGPPHVIGDRRYIDGAFRANENADLAAGYERVLVLSPLGGKSWAPSGWGTSLRSHAEQLRSHGSRVETVFADEATLAAFGEDMMSPASRPPSARAGHAQGTALASRLAEFWR